MAGETPDVQYKAAEGTPDQMQRGDATELNAGLPTENPTAPEPAVAAPDTSEPEPAQASDYEPVYQPEGEDEAFITGPTTRPNEPVTTGALAGNSKGLPQNLVAAMPVFAEAASLPDAPPQLKALVAALSALAES